MAIVRRTIFTITTFMLITGGLCKDLRNNVTSQESIENQTNTTSQQSIDAQTRLLDHIVEAKCISVAGEEKGKQLFKVYQESLQEVRECFKNALDVKELQADIEKAVREGNYSPIFHKHCQKSSGLQTCGDTFYANIVGCSDMDEKEFRKISRSMLEAILGFICHNDGEHIVNLINEKGVECFQMKSAELQECIKTSYAEFFAVQENAVMPTFVINEKECNRSKSFQTCMINELQKCERQTAATFVQDLIKSVKSVVDPCSKFEKPGTQVQ